MVIAIYEKRDILDSIVRNMILWFLSEAGYSSMPQFFHLELLYDAYILDIESELGLTREKLMRTEGISGIGFVNAAEVLNAFPEKDGLQKFREWIQSPDPSILGKVNAKEGSSTRKTGSNISAEEASTVDDDKHCNPQWTLEVDFDSIVVRLQISQVAKAGNVEGNEIWPLEFPMTVKEKVVVIPEGMLISS
ncbi:XPG/Rad2 endonuclease, PIN domain-like protein [Artemisia annua]|uniref:XPG/Rad2 endonuclease, PIN domain-like protein n=1 Tax=Artemisia annua TaxID=35608 RepID=A0A2U1MM09_ARTAN|nr:XPG/Rad2 endonuclease, PIN domain-like protein [Artemisia annua]